MGVEPVSLDEYNKAPIQPTYRLRLMSDSAHILKLR